MNDDEEIIKKKIKIYSNDSKAIHLELDNGKFYNGFVMEYGADFIILQDNKIGEVICFISEIDVVEPYSPKGKR